MATIREHLDEMVEANRQHRIAMFIETQAPKVLIESEQARVGMGAARIGKINTFGSLEYTEVSKHTGLGGKPYLRFKNPTGNDILLVTGKFGPYLYRQKGKRRDETHG